MCLSNVYRGEIADNNLLLGNVQRIECRDGNVVLTDILEREMTIPGEVQMADLVNGKVIIAPREQ